MRSQPNCFEVVLFCGCCRCWCCFCCCCCCSCCCCRWWCYSCWCCCLGNIKGWSEAPCDGSWVWVGWWWGGVVVGGGGGGVQTHFLVKPNSVELSWGCVELGLWQLDIFIHASVFSINLLGSKEERLFEKKIPVLMKHKFANFTSLLMGCKYVTSSHLRPFQTPPLPLNKIGWDCLWCSQKI